MYVPDPPPCHGGAGGLDEVLRSAGFTLRPLPLRLLLLQERERVCGEARRSSFERREGGQGGGAHHPLGEVASVLASFSLVRRGVPLFILGGVNSRFLGGVFFADWIVVYAGAVGLVLFGAVLGGGGVFRGGEEGGFRGVLPWKFLFFCVLLRFSSVLGLKIAAF